MVTADLASSVGVLSLLSPFKPTEERAFRSGQKSEEDAGVDSSILDALACEERCSTFSVVVGSVSMLANTAAVARWTSCSLRLNSVAR